MDMTTFGNRFHGHNERIDESLGLATDFWLGICRELLG